MSDAAAPEPAPKEPDVEIHKPKPVHSWRELLTEIGVVVIGVCIALAAEQTVEFFHWRDQVRAARESIATEMAVSIGFGIERVRTEGCIEKRLDELGRILDAASRTGVLPPVGDIGTPHYRPFPSGAWNSVVASQVATHFSRPELAVLSSAYEQVALLGANNQAEILVWADLDAMAGPGRRLDPALDAALHAALSRARFYNRAMALVGGQLSNRARTMNLPLNMEEKKFIRDRLDASLGQDPMCRPIGPVAATYGQAPLTNLLPEIEGRASERRAFDAWLGPDVK
jgi:hypothetical protein